MEYGPRVDGQFQAAGLWPKEWETGYCNYDIATDEDERERGG